MKKIMLLGSGELGKEFVIAAQRLGQTVVACDSYAGAPAMQVTDACEVFHMLDGDALAAAVGKHRPDIIVPEIEAIRTERLYEFEKAGVQVADIVVEVDGTRVSSMEEMTSILQSKQAGDTATLKVYRVEGGLDSYEDQTSIPDGEYIDLTVELAMLDAAAQ